MRFQGSKEGWGCKAGKEGDNMDLGMRYASAYRLSYQPYFQRFLSPPL
jgi:hypothetical protein